MDCIFSSNFPSFEVAYEAINAAAKAEGFALVIHRRRPTENPTNVMLRCSKGRRWSMQVDNSLRRRSSSSQMTGCGYRIIVKRSPRDPFAPWHVSVAGERSHNHEFTPAITHAKYRAEIVARYRDEIVSYHNQGLRPTQIYAQLLMKTEDFEGVSKRQIYNAVQLLRREQPPSS